MAVLLLAVLAMVSIAIRSFFPVEKVSTDRPDAAAGDVKKASISEPREPVSAPDPAPSAPEKPRRMLSLIFSGSPRAVRLESSTSIDAMPKPGRRPDGRYGIYYRAVDAHGTTLADGIIPDPYEIRVPLPKPGDPVPPAVTGPIPPRDEATFNIRLPDLPRAEKVELFHVPPTAQPSDARDRSEWRIGSFPLSRR